jgi:tetratricopeptide (TPR) repeat protein
MKQIGGIVLKKPFDEKELPIVVRKHYKANRNNPCSILAYLEEHYQDEQMENMQLALFFSYIEMKCATAVYVDEVGEVLKKARTRLKGFTIFPQVLAFLKDVEKLERLEKRRRSRLNKLLTMDFDSLDLSDKKDVAYELSGSKNADCKALAAQYFLKLYQETKELHYFCNYASSLYNAGQKREAMEAYERIEELFKTEVYPDKGWVMLGIHADRMDYFKEDRLAFRMHWDSAKMDPHLKEITCDFPAYPEYVTSFAEISLQYGFIDICDELVSLLKKNKLQVPPKVKAHYDGLFH